jgi:hypothetical protein
MTNEEHKALLAALPEPVREARAALPIEAAELLDYPRDLNDAAHEHADGSADVIYYSRAHRLCAECSASELADAEDDLEDMGTQPKTYNEFASALAYCIVRTRYADEVREALESYREALMEAWEEATKELDDTEDGPPAVRAMDRDVEALETILG